MIITVNGQGIKIDEEGYLTDYTAWSPEVASYLALEDKKVFKDSHFDVINLVRNYYEEYTATPSYNVLVRLVRKTLGESRDSIYLTNLFWGDPSIKTLCKYSGLPKPTGCI